MCRAGGRRCQGSATSSRTTQAARQRRSRAHRALAKAKASGDPAAITKAEQRVAALDTTTGHTTKETTVDNQHEHETPDQARDVTNTGGSATGRDAGTGRTRTPEEEAFLNAGTQWRQGWEARFAAQGSATESAGHDRDVTPRSDQATGRQDNAGQRFGGIGQIHGDVGRIINNPTGSIDVSNTLGGSREDRAARRAQREVRRAERDAARQSRQGSTPAPDGETTSLPGIGRIHGNVGRVIDNPTGSIRIENGRLFIDGREVTDE